MSRKPQERVLVGELTIALLSAIARIKTGAASGAIKDFEKAYSLSYGGVFEMPFIERGKDLRPLVAAASKQEGCGIPREWLKTIDRKASIFAKKYTVILNSFKKDKNIDDGVQLSERESEALNDLYHGLSREEIATNRYLSINTVHKTIQSIYIKLNAKNIADALRIAIEKGLVE
jgi:DNA-binding CsgD family transcriptional regulator